MNESHPKDAGQSDRPDEEGSFVSERDLREIKGSLRIIAVTCIALLLVLFAVAFRALAPMLKPLAVSVVFCYLIYPSISFLVRHRIPRLLAYAMGAGGLFTLLYIIGQLIALNVARFSSNIGDYRENLSSYLVTIDAVARRYRLILPGEELSTDKIMSTLPDDLFARLLGGSTTFAFDFVGNLLIIVLFMVFILLETERLEERVRLAYGPEQALRILGVVENINKHVQRYLVIKVLLSFVTAVVATAIMGAFGLHFYFLLGTSVFFFNFIPYFGSIFATIIPTVLALLQFSSPGDALWLALLLTGVQFFIGNLLDPQLLGRNLNLSPVLILVALAFWAWLWGVLGMVLAVPIMVTIRIALEHFPETRPYAILMSNMVVEHSEKAEARGEM